MSRMPWFLVLSTNASSCCLGRDLGEVNVKPCQAVNSGKSKEDYLSASLASHRKISLQALSSQATGSSVPKVLIHPVSYALKDRHIHGHQRRPHDVDATAAANRGFMGYESAYRASTIAPGPYYRIQSPLWGNNLSSSHSHGHIPRQ